jgi:hypothetical protein
MPRGNKHQHIIGRLECLMLRIPGSINLFVIAALFGVLLLLLERGHSMAAAAESTAEIRNVGYTEAITRVLQSKLSQTTIGDYNIESKEHPAHLVLRIRGLQVDAKPRAYQAYLVKQVSIEPIDAELVLTTRVFEDESGTEMLRIDAQLINSRDGFRLWSHDFESELTDLDTIYHEICRALAAAMELTVDGANEGQIVQNQYSMIPTPLPRT